MGLLTPKVVETGNGKMVAQLVYDPNGGICPIDESQLPGFVLRRSRTDTLDPTSG